MSDLIENPEDKFSHVDVQFSFSLNVFNIILVIK